MRHIKALQNTIDQGIRLDSVDLDANGDYSSILCEGRSFLLDLPISAGTMGGTPYEMKVQFPDGHIGIYKFMDGTSPIVKVVKVFSTGSDCRQFQVIY